VVYDDPNLTTFCVLYTNDSVAFGKGTVAELSFFMDVILEGDAVFFIPETCVVG